WRPLARDATATSHEWGHAEAIRELLHKTVRKAIKDPRATAFALATGRLKVSPFDDSTIQEVRSQIAAMLPDPAAAMEVPPGQPFMLHLLSQSLEMLGDPDFEILDHGSESFAEGVPLVGTFGVSSAAYYWTRLFAAVGRWAFRVLHLDKFYMLIYVDDLHVVVFGGEKFYALWALFLALEIMGTPFAYHKFKGGLEVDYIGYHLDYFSWAAGISEKRAGWIVEWIDRAESMSWVVTGSFAFSSEMVPVLIVLGGWSLDHGLDTRQEDLSSEWASTAAELLGSYAGLVAFGHTKASGGRDHLRLQVCAGTDNKSTPAITAKGLSNKWPVQGIHMQLATTLRQANKLCKLSWRPREENQDADDLTNLRTDNFCAARQVHLTLDDIPLDLFRELQSSHADFLSAREKLLTTKKAEVKTSKRQKLLDKTEW
ncbi:unnamed protein product, partial [Symbiodinium sp. KB8]